MEINPDARRIAQQLDVERAEGQHRGPLHGLPVLIKGNIGTKDRMQTNAGSYALQDTILPADSTVASKLRAQGLIILGKTSLTEWSMFRSSNSTHAWSPIGGQIYGAYCPKQCPGGSSGGSAVATDLGLAWAALGTETSGSIVSPSERNNCVGVKPTVGLTSRYLVVPVSEHQDTVGVMARTVRDAARLLQVIAGVDPNDAYTFASPFQERVPDYVAACKCAGLEGKRIGIARNVLDSSAQEISHTIKAFEAAISAMAKAGAIIIDNANFTSYEKWAAMKYNPVTRADFASDIADYLCRLEGNPKRIHNVEDIRAFTRSHPEEDYIHRDTATWDMIIDKNMTNTSQEFSSWYNENLAHGDEGGVIGSLKKHSLDAVAMPSAVAFPIPALVGTPIITVPLGITSNDVPIELEKGWDVVEKGPGIPFGLSFLGPKWSEETLFEMAYAFEQQTLTREAIARGQIISASVDLADIINGVCNE
ncbi:amidase signature domain-containing protein [Xylaria telfairii]|nr:amidase signature domain-containing protein [Xylaria telfairii]